MKRLHLSALALSALLLTACGGGGDDGPAATATPSSNTGGGAQVTSVTASQSGAEALIRTTNDNVDTVASATAGNTLPGMASQFSAGGHMQALSSVNSAAVQPQAASTTTVECKTVGSGGGSGTMDITSNFDGLGNYTSQVEYHNCVVAWEGGTITYNGTSSSSTTRSETTTTTAYSYDIAYQYTGTASESGTLRSSSTCVTDNKTFQTSCSYDVGNANVTATSSVQTNGNVTSIGKATVKTNAANASESLTIVYENWVYDVGTNRATGKATITDSAGNTATIVGVASGGMVTYTVTIVYQGNTSVYTVTM